MGTFPNEDDAGAAADPASAGEGSPAEGPIPADGGLPAEGPAPADGEPSRTARRLPPLDPDEAWVLSFNLLASQALMLAAGAVGSAIAVGLATGDWVRAVVGFGWAHAIAASLAALPFPATVAAACAVAALFAVAAWASERRASSTESGRESVRAGRRGVNGELPRLPFAVVFLLMCLAGLSEELLFRFALTGVVSGFLSPALPPFLTALVALFVSSVAFWFAHVRYRDLATTVLTLGLGLGLGIAFLASGSLAVVAIAHALYDVAVIVIARVRMLRDPDYFSGPAPTRALLDQLEEEESSGQQPREDD